MYIIIIIKCGLTLTICCCCCCCLFVCLFVVVLLLFFGGGGGGGLEGGQTVSLYSAYYAPNKFSSLLFSPGTLNGHVDNVV